MPTSLRAALIAAIAALVVPAQADAARTICNAPLKMSDGVTLRANVYLPDAPGRYPTILTATGYNKDVTNVAGLPGCANSSGLAAPDLSLVEAGYVVMLLDDRGTGASEGKWDAWGERSQLDYRESIDWIVGQEWSDGQIATTGASYMGITSLLIAEQDAIRVKEGKPRAVKTIWADVPMADAYRDVTFHGGGVDAGFIPLWLGLTTSLGDLPPSTLTTEPESALPTWLDHLRNGYDFAGSMVVNATTGGDRSFDGPFYELRSPGTRAASIKVPVAWTGGWFDIFQRGETLLYELLKNAPVKKMWMTPIYHTAGEDTWGEQGIGSRSEVKRKWFDRWLKNDRNGVEDLPNVNLWTMGSRQWQHARSWPLPKTKYTSLYLDQGGALKTEKAAEPSSTRAPLMPASSPCSRLTAQWTAGAAAAIPTPCETDNRTFEAAATTFTTPVLEKDTEATGIVSADVFAELTSTDATLVAVVSDVKPDGSSEQITSGFLLASQRAIDVRRSTKGRSGRILRPFHPFTKASQEPVVPNEAERYRIDIYPTSHVFQAGHRIRLTIATANTPTTFTPVPAMTPQLGGEIRFLHGPRYPSRLVLPLR